MIEKFGKSESPELVGRVVTHLAQNPSMMKYTGKIVSTADYTWTHSIVDIDGQYPQNMRSISFLMQNIPALKWLSSWIPSWLKIPYWLLHQMANKF
jgi:dehydrogenase/reductase SDR family protein 1